MEKNHWLIYNAQVFVFQFFISLINSLSTNVLVALVSHLFTVEYRLIVLVVLEIVLYVCFESNLSVETALEI